MKKLTLIILIAFMGIVNAMAQEADSLQTQQTDVIVDGVTIAKYNKLQRDFDFLRCKFEVTEMNNALDSFIQDVKISSLEVRHNCHHGSFNYDLYKAYKAGLNLKKIQLEKYKEKCASVATQVALIVYMYESDFSELEKDLLTKGLDMFDRYIESAEGALKIYEIAIDMYGR